MKKISSILLAGAILLGLAGCTCTKPRQELPDTASVTTEPSYTEQANTPIPYRIQHIRTNGGQDGASFPQVQIISDPQSLKDYYTANHQIYDLERKEQVYADTTIGFLDACDQYNNAFFEKSFLIFVLLEEGSGSVRHQIRNVEQTPDQKLSISIESILPGGFGTSDMAQWHIILELSRSVLVNSADDVLVYWNERLAFDGHAVPPQAEPPLKKPPEVILRTPAGDFDLTIGGCSWFYDTDDGLSDAVLADQSSRPVPSAKHHPITIDSKYAETIYMPTPGGGPYSPTNSLGYLMKLSWGVEPTSVTYTCWPDTVWQDNTAPEYIVDSYQDHAFYAKPGGYIYEIAATWADTGAGYHGTANYYVYIIGGA